MHKDTKFKPEQFIPSKFASAAQKARFANQFVKFVRGDFKATLFPKWFYQRLSNTFGHIAHFDHGTFYNTFFTTLEGRVRFLRVSIQYPFCGDPAYTFCDVEKVLQQWIIGNQLIEQAQQALGDAVQQQELTQLRHLIEKHGIPEGVR